ncbi:hypothetical protein BH24ACT1_BH24ACT1_13380 [soil metagenome]
MKSAVRSDLDAPTRWPALEGIRGIAVLAVVLFHATRLVLLRDGGNWGDVSPVWWPVATGRFGVDVFFVLSGFLIVGSWRAARQRTVSFGRAVADCAGRRAWRVLPPYWVSLLVLVPLAAPHLLGEPDNLLRLITVQQYFDTHLPSEINVVYWSLTTEVHFYLVVPVVGWVLHRVGGWPLVAAAVALGVWWIETESRGEFPASFISGRLHQFAVGAVAAGLVARHEQGDTPRLVRLATAPAMGWVLVVAAGALGVYHGATYRRPSEVPIEGYLHLVASFVIAAAVINLLCRDRLTVCHSRPLRFFGLISYSIYLWHFPVLEYGLPLVGLDAGGTTTGSLAGVAALWLILLSLLAGLAAYLLVERPFIQLQAKRTSRRKREVAKVTEANNAPAKTLR